MSANEALEDAQVALSALSMRTEKELSELTEERDLAVDAKKSMKGKLSASELAIGVASFELQKGAESLVVEVSRD